VRLASLDDQSTLQQQKLYFCAAEEKKKMKNEWARPSGVHGIKT